MGWTSIGSIKVGTRRKKKQLQAPYGFENTVSAKLDRNPFLGLPYVTLLIYIIFGLPYFQFAKRYKAQNWYQGKLNSSIFQI